MLHYCTNSIVQKQKNLKSFKFKRRKLTLNKILLKKLNNKHKKKLNKTVVIIHQYHNSSSNNNNNNNNKFLKIIVKKIYKIIIVSLPAQKLIKISIS